MDNYFRVSSSYIPTIPKIVRDLLTLIANETLPAAVALTKALAPKGLSRTRKLSPLERLNLTLNLGENLVFRLTKYAGAGPAAKSLREIKPFSNNPVNVHDKWYENIKTMVSFTAGTVDLEQATQETRLALQSKETKHMGMQILHSIADKIYHAGQPQEANRLLVGNATALAAAFEINDLYLKKLTDQYCDFNRRNFNWDHEPYTLSIGIKAIELGFNCAVMRPSITEFGLEMAEMLRDRNDFDHSEQVLKKMMIYTDQNSDPRIDVAWNATMDAWTQTAPNYAADRLAQRFNESSPGRKSHDVALTRLRHVVETSTFDSAVYEAKFAPT